MQIPQIRVQTEPALLRIDQQRGTMQMEQPHGDLRIEQPSAVVQMRRMAGWLTIDQTQAWEDMGKFGPLRAAQMEAQDGYQDWLQYLGKTMQEGEQMRRTDLGGNPFAQIAKNNAIQEKQFALAWIPSYGSVRINAVPGQQDINIEAQKPIIDGQPNAPRVSYTPGNVTYSLLQANSLAIDFVYSDPYQIEMNV